MSVWDDIWKNIGHAVGINNDTPKPVAPTNTLRQQATLPVQRANQQQVQTPQQSPLEVSSQPVQSTNLTVDNNHKAAPVVLQSPTQLAAPNLSMDLQHSAPDYSAYAAKLASDYAANPDAGARSDYYNLVQKLANDPTNPNHALATQLVSKLQTPFETNIRHAIGDTFDVAKNNVFGDAVVGTGQALVQDGIAAAQTLAGQPNGKSVNISDPTLQKVLGTDSIGNLYTQGQKLTKAAGTGALIPGTDIGKGSWDNPAFNTFIGLGKPLVDAAGGRLVEGSGIDDVYKIGLGIKNAVVKVAGVFGKHPDEVASIVTKSINGEHLTHSEQNIADAVKSDSNAQTAATETTPTTAESTPAVTDKGVTPDATTAIANGDEAATSEVVQATQDTLPPEAQASLVTDLTKAKSPEDVQKVLSQYGIPVDETASEQGARIATEGDAVAQKAQQDAAGAAQQQIETPTEPTAPQETQGPATAPSADVAQNNAAFAGGDELAQLQSIPKADRTVDQQNRINDLISESKTAPAQPTISDLSKTAKNSFENAPTGVKPGGIKRAAAEIDNGSAQPIRYRTTPEGDLVIEDGRHRLEAARKAGIEDFPAQDVTSEYTKKDVQSALNDGAPTPEGKAKLDEALGTPNPEGAVKRATTAPPTTEEKLYDSSKGDVANQTYTRILSDPTIKPSTKKLLENATHGQQDQKALRQAAKQLVGDNAEQAARLAESEDLRLNNPAAHTYLLDELSKDAYKNGNDAKGAEYEDAIIEHQTRGGQTINSGRNLDIHTPNRIVKFYERQMDKQGRVPSEEVKKALLQVAKKYIKMDDGPEKDGLAKTMTEMATDTGAIAKAKQLAEQITSLPRTLLATADVSALGRQGAILAAGHPIEAGKAFAESLKYAYDPKAFAAGMHEVLNLTDKDGASIYPFLKKHGLGLEGVQGNSEEVFGNTGLLEHHFNEEGKLGMVGKVLNRTNIVSASDRAYTGALTVLRARVAKNIIDSVGGIKEVNKWSKKEADVFTRVIDTLSGRGHFGIKEIEDAAPLLSKTFFSARLWKSRLDLLNPAFYAQLRHNPAAAKEAARSLGAFLGLATAVLGLAKAAGAGVETDPRSSDFGKIKIGDTRYDVLAGTQQNIVLLAREVTGQTKSTTTGDVTSLDGKNGRDDKISIIMRTLDNKLSPIVGAAINLWRGKDQMGNPVTPAGVGVGLITPLNVQSTYEDMQATGDNLLVAGAKNLPGLVGIGVNTYSGSKAGPAKTPDDIAKMSADDQATYVKNTKTDFGKTLSKDDQAKYKLFGLPAEVRNLQIKEGKVTQDQLDTIKAQENRYLQSHNLPIDTGYSPEDLAKFSPTTQNYITEKALDGPSGKKDKTKSTDAAKAVIAEATSADNLWPTLNAADIKPSNALADKWVTYQKDLQAAGDDQAAQYDAQKKFWSAAVKQTFDSKVVGAYELGDSTNEKNTYSMSAKTIEGLVSTKGIKVGNQTYHINKQDLDNMVALDNRLVSAGLIASPKFSDKVRASYGYDAAPASQIEGTGYAGKTSGSGGGGGGGYMSGYTNASKLLQPFEDQIKKFPVVNKAATAPKADFARFKNKAKAASKSSIQIKL